jgi:hypothetical protein
MTVNSVWVIRDGERAHIAGRDVVRVDNEDRSDRGEYYLAAPVSVPGSSFNSQAAIHSAHANAPLLGPRAFTALPAVPLPM